MQLKASAMNGSADHSSQKPYSHPLDPLTSQEIVLASSAIRSYTNALEVPLERLLFNSITLKEPPKLSVLKWGGVVKAPEVEAASDVITRQADVHCLDAATARAFECIVDLPSNLDKDRGKTVLKPAVSSWTALDKAIQPSLQVEELLWAEEICRKSPVICEAAEAVGVAPADIYVDGWCIGVDERFPNRRLQQCFLFTRSRPEDNLYAHPLDFIPVIDSYTGEIMTIDYPHLNGPDAPSSATAHAALPPRDRIPPPMEPHNYLHSELKQDEADFKPREGLKPIEITQPEGVSFKFEGRVLVWQNWRFHVGFNFREGMVLSNITYDDGKNGTRPLFYRLSVAEMVVPYAKTTFPHHRKHAFDTGEYGIGALANSLELGCDCKGKIAYLDFEGSSRNGEVETIKNAVCIHEEDAGILHKHTDFRTNKAQVARNRKLIVSSICTVANYEYGFYFTFDLAGTIELEVKATGIVNAYLLAEGEARDADHEVIVAPRIAAQHHQHLFSLRVDPMLDGLKNQVVQVDAVPDEAPLGSAANYYGNGFHAQKTVYKTTKESVADYDAKVNRIWSMENPNKKNKISGANVGYKLVCGQMPPMLAAPGSMVWNRAPFARHNMFVTPYAEDELYPSGLHINQHPGGDSYGLAEWVDRDASIVNEDVVVWASFGMTHFSRPEDWPIMPVEMLRLHLKPSSFFDRNPGLDVPSSVDMASKLAKDSFSNSSSTNGTSQTSCCSKA
ncbi:peroxisomal copper amine oxidase [Phaffia rhodozyma]|uniref:Amine oxidase n=1 Tax=Phaffia rhodozyma TaxID=264483 RepID=A0A0F7SMR5_PHARH|nr:peroxisomal copper amine oxidase [Phaffia rhodozyma]